MSDETYTNGAQARREQRVVIVMGSDRDTEHCGKITAVLERLNIACDVRVGSAHKTPEHVMEIIADYNRQDLDVVFIAVAGRSNALGGFMDFQTVHPVISSPPYSQSYGGADIYSSLRMPSGLAAVTAAEPEMAALHAAKILTHHNPELAARYAAYQIELKEKVIAADRMKMA